MTRGDVRGRGHRIGERNGVRLGQAAVDLDGRPLGEVTALYAWGFAVRRGLFLFRRDAVIRYDEVRGVRDGTLVVARSERDLFVLAAGGIPPSWRIPTPAGFPDAATPSEAAALRAQLAQTPLPGPRPAGPDPGPAPPLAPEDVRAYVDARGEVQQVALGAAVRGGEPQASGGTRGVR